MLPIVAGLLVKPSTSCAACQPAPIEIVATAADDQTLIAEIARLMQAAEQSKSVYVRLADRAAALYAPVVHALGAATFVGWMVAGAGVETALTTAIAVLIITCPCALALAVPAVQVAAVSRLFGQGVIVTSADGLERMADADTLVLDKTGTLTLGEPRLLNGDQISDAALATAASLGVNSRHPYARAVVRAALDRGVSFAARSGVTEVPGCGLEAASSDTSGVEVATVARLGSARWVLGAAAAETPAPETATSPTLWLQTSAPSAPVAFAFEDALREDAAHVVNQARRAGLDVLLLSGDRRATVEQAAAAAGITNWRAEQKPADKIAVLDELKASGRHVLMVGDGLNDAPALAAAYASLAMSNAVAVSQIAADGIVQGQRLEPVLQTIAMARRARGLSLSNFGIAAAYNAIFIPVAMAGFVTPLIAALAMSASSILVTANALRLRRAQLTLPPVRTRRTAP